MAISFSDLHTEAGIKSLDEFLAGKAYISGDRLTKDDIKVFAAVLEKPSGGYPNASRWYETVSSHLATRFPGEAVGVRFSGQAATTVAAPAQEVKKEVPEGDDDDDLDLFGDETEEEKKAAEEREAAVKASSKKKESGKSSVLLEVKPWDDETDMKKLEEAVRSVEMPGLLWGASKLVPVGYGIKKLQIMMTIVDDLVSVDNLIEDHLSVEPANEYIHRDKSSGVSIDLVGDQLSHLAGTISGPIGTPYEGGVFRIDVRLPDGYPFEPPKMQFVTKVWHPNISSQNGAICLDILKDQWSPALTLKTALLSLQALLSAPEPDDPQDAVVAQQYLRDYPTFLGTARYWTEAFARRVSIGTEEKVQKLVEMGFPEALVRTTLENAGGDENMALEKLCSG